jgi:hypothetical protein
MRKGGESFFFAAVAAVEKSRRVRNNNLIAYLRFTISNCWAVLDTG